MNRLSLLIAVAAGCFLIPRGFCAPVGDNAQHELDQAILERSVEQAILLAPGSAPQIRADIPSPPPGDVTTLDSADPAGLLSRTTGQTMFDKIKYLYSHPSSAPTKEELTGLQLGRCYVNEKGVRDQAVPSLMAGMNLRDDGPLGEEFKIVPVSYSATPDYLDRLDLESSYEAAFRFVLYGTDIKPIYRRSTYARAEGGGFVGRFQPILDPDGEQTFVLAYHVRKAGPYYVIKQVVVKSPHEWFKPGAVYSYCYYFRKIIHWPPQE